PDRDAIDSSTSLLLHDLSSSLTNLSSAESLRQETHASVLRSRYGRGRAGRILFRWAGGKSALPDGSGAGGDDGEGKSGEQLRDEEIARVTRAVRESVLWFLRRALEGAVVRQRELVERRIERARERERSVLYKSAQQQQESAAGAGAGAGARPEEPMPSGGDPAITEAESKEIESQLSPEQLQLFAEENDSMLQYYQDTLSKVQHAEKSLLEISSLQQSLVSHLATQEDYIGQLVTDAAATQTNIGGGNRELRRATEKRSTAQAVFWGTVGVCTWLVVWDLIF
ncbi:snare protein, partial [Aspergillus sp. HF37]